MERHPTTPDPLRTISDGEIRALRESYRQGLPDTLAPYAFIDNCVRWTVKFRGNSTTSQNKQAWPLSPSVRVQFFTLVDTTHDGLLESGTFVAVTGAEKNPVVTFGTLREDLAPLKDALMRTARIDWRRDPAFSCVALEHYPMLQDVLKVKAPRLEFRNSTFFRLPHEVARKLQFGVPEGYDFLPLDVSHAREVNDTWPHRYEGSEEYYRALLLLNGGLALVQRSTLVGWVLTNEYGALGHLYIHPAHRQRGLASALAKAWTVRMAQDDETGADVIAYILDANATSRALFQKLGFIEMYKSRWSNPSTERK